MTKISTQINDLKNYSHSSLVNKIINGNFDFAQRTTSVAMTGTQNWFAADRFGAFRTAGINNPTLSVSADVPTLAQSGFKSANSLLITMNSTPSTPGASDVAAIDYRIEGNDYAELHGQYIRCCFWVKSSVAGTYVISFENGNNDRNYSTTYTINQASTWEKKNIDITLDTSGTWFFDHQVGLKIRWGLTSGSTFETATLNQWQAGNFYSTSGSVDLSTTASATFQLAQVMLVKGKFDSSADLSFVRAGRSITDELQLCQRYYEKTYNTGVPPASAADDGAEYFCVAAGTNVAAPMRFKVSKRIAPTVTLYTMAGVVNNVRDTSAGTNRSAVVEFPGHNGFRLLIASTTSGNNHGVHWIADCEL